MKPRIRFSRAPTPERQLHKSCLRGLATAVLLVFVAPLTLHADPQLNENCVVTILNRNIQVAADGGWSLPNVPSSQGRIRARATCINEDGTTTSGQSDYFTVVTNGITQVSDIVFQNLDPIPALLSFSPGEPVALTGVGETAQLAVTATYPDSSTQDVTPAASGTNYSSTNSAVATIGPDGLVTAVARGIGKRSCVFGASDNYDSVKLEPMRESDPRAGIVLLGS